MSGLGNVAVVVGIGPSTGRSVAVRFAREGYKVALVARRLESSKPVEDEIVKAGGQALSVAADTGNEADVKEAHKLIVGKLGHPEVLIYNASPGGLSWPLPGLLEQSAEKFARGFDAGVTGALIWLQQLLPAQIQAGRGTVIFTGATASVRGSAKFAQLAAPKFALRALAQSTAREFQSKGIHVAHVIIDGVIESEQWKGSQPDEHLAPDQIAEEYWRLHTQHRSAWTQELDLRPYLEKF